MKDMKTDLLIVGGGVGGCAAAMAATSMGLRVVMSEPTDWIGGQITSQAVPEDENPWIEQFGCTRRYRQYRNGIRQYYRDHYPLTTAARMNPRLNPGEARVSRIAHEPRVGLAVLEQMLAPARSAQRLRTLLHHEPVAADVSGDRVRSVTLRSTTTGDELTVEAPYVLDASELGDLLPLTGTEYVTGFESKRRYGEPHAPDGPDQPDNVQALSWCFAMGYDPHGEHIIEKPAMYDFWRDYVPPLPPAWPGKLLSWHHASVRDHSPVRMGLFPEEVERGEAKWAAWNFRRIAFRGHYPDDQMSYDVTLVNWPQIDYIRHNIIDVSPQQRAESLHEARQLSLSFVHWLQTEAPRADGKAGYPGLFLCPEITGTHDGLAKAPYIRESRRIQATFTVTENHVGFDANGRQMITVSFPDSVGIGFYGIDLHPSTGGDNYIDIGGLPDAIPLGALLPVPMRNLLPAAKNIGTTHMTNGCYRLHPIEWNIGESAALLVAYCVQAGVEPHAVAQNADRLKDYQSLLTRQGIELNWPRVP